MWQFLCFLYNGSLLTAGPQKQVTTSTRKPNTRCVYHVCWRCVSLCLTMCCHVFVDDVCRLFSMFTMCLNNVLHVCMTMLYTMVNTCLTIVDQCFAYVDHVFRMCWPCVFRIFVVYFHAPPPCKDTTSKLPCIFYGMFDGYNYGVFLKGTTKLGIADHVNFKFIQCTKNSRLKVCLRKHILHNILFILWYKLTHRFDDVRHRFNVLRHRF
jgi:hypothetical protein